MHRVVPLGLDRILMISGTEWVPSSRALEGSTEFGAARFLPPTGHRYEYTYLAADLFTDEIIAELPLNSVTFSWSRNAPGELSGTLPAPIFPRVRDYMRATRPARTAIYVLRDGYPIWGGIIWKRSLGSETREVQIEADTFDSYMYHRILDQDIYFVRDVYGCGERPSNVSEADWAKRKCIEGTEQTDIFRFLWRHMSGTLEEDPVWGPLVSNAKDRANLNANIGVVLSPTPVATKKRGRYFKKWDFKTYGEHVEALAGLSNGFDWCSLVAPAPEDAMTPSGIQRLITFGYPHLGRPYLETGFIWEYPGAMINYSWDADADKAITRAIIQGQGEGDLAAVADTFNEVAIRNLGYPLLDGTYAHSSVPSLTTLYAHAGKYLRAYEPPVGTFTMTIHPNLPPTLWYGSDEHYFIGDEIGLKIDDDMFNWSEVRARDMTLRIKSISVTPNDEGLESVQPEVEIVSRDVAIIDEEESEDDEVPDTWTGPAITPLPDGEITIQRGDGTERTVMSRSMVGTIWAQGQDLIYDPTAEIDDEIGTGWVRSRP